MGDKLSKKGSDLRTGAAKAELVRVVEEFTNRLETDPYQPGIIHPNLFPDEVSEAIEDVLWIRGFSEMTIRVNKDDSGSTISMEIIDRK